MHGVHNICARVADKKYTEKQVLDELKAALAECFMDSQKKLDQCNTQSELKQVCLVLKQMSEPGRPDSNSSLPPPA